MKNEDVYELTDIETEHYLQPTRCNQGLPQIPNQAPKQRKLVVFMVLLTFLMSAATLALVIMLISTTSKKMEHAVDKSSKKMEHAMDKCTTLSGKQFIKMTSARTFPTKSMEMNVENETAVCAAVCKAEPDCDGFFVTGRHCNRISVVTSTIQSDVAKEIFFDVEAYQMATAPTAKLKLDCPERQVSSVVSQRECMRLAQSDLEANTLSYDETNSMCYVQKCTAGDGFQANYHFAKFITMFSLNFYPRTCHQRIFYMAEDYTVCDCPHLKTEEVTRKGCGHLLCLENLIAANFHGSGQCYLKSCGSTGFSVSHSNPLNITYYSMLKIKPF